MDRGFAGLPEGLQPSNLPHSNSEQTIAGEATRILDSVAIIDKMHPLGSHEHAEILARILAMQWPRIKAVLSLIRR